jgi:hypothetical protein
MKKNSFIAAAILITSAVAAQNNHFLKTEKDSL